MRALDFKSNDMEYGVLEFTPLYFASCPAYDAKLASPALVKRPAANQVDAGQFLTAMLPWPAVLPLTPASVHKGGLLLYHTAQACANHHHIQ